MFRKGILCLLLCAATATAEPRGIALKKDHRVPNRTDIGVCWWASAEMVGNHFGIDPLRGLAADVPRDGYGWVHGAYDETIEYWMKKKGVRASRVPGAFSPQAADEILKLVEGGTPVICCMNVVPQPSGPHALHAWLLIRYDREKDEVHYVDTNAVGTDIVTSRKNWYALWFGRAWVIDPKQGK